MGSVARSSRGQVAVISVVTGVRESPVPLRERLPGVECRTRPLPIGAGLARKRIDISTCSGDCLSKLSHAHNALP
jgi:hypothetical protein